MGKRLDHQGERQRIKQSATAVFLRNAGHEAGGRDFGPKITRRRPRSLGGPGRAADVVARQSLGDLANGLLFVCQLEIQSGSLMTLANALNRRCDIG